MLRYLTLTALVIAAAGVGRAADEAKLEHKVYTGYFESNKSGLKGDASHLVIKDQTTFDGIFRLRPPLLGGKKAEPLPKDAFDKGQIVVATIKRGPAITTYTVEKVAIKDGVLTVAYKAMTKDGGGTARFASPLIVAVPGKGVTSVEFIENGAKVATVKPR